MKLQFCAKNMLAFVEKPEYSSRVSNQQKNEVVQLAQKALTWLNSNKEADVEEIKQHQTELDNYFIPLMQNLSGSKPQVPQMNQ